MISKWQTLPVRLHVSSVHTVHVTVSEDNQPMLPGVSQNVSYTRLLSHPVTHLPAQPWSLPFVSATAELKRGGRLDDMSHVNALRGEGGGSRKCVHNPARCHTVHFSLWSSSFFTSSLSHTHTALHTLWDPLWWLWQPFVKSKRFLLKQNQSPPPSVCCWILRGAFRSCQFVQVGIKKTELTYIVVSLLEKKLEEKLGELSQEKALRSICPNDDDVLTEKQEMRARTTVLQGQVVFCPSVYSANTRDYSSKLGKETQLACHSKKTSAPLHNHMNARIFIMRTNTHTHSDSVLGI